MSRATRTRSTWLASACLVLAPLAFATAAAPVKPEEPPKTPIEAMKRDVFGMQGHLQNMKVKIDRPMSGAGAAGPGATPAESCCSGNIEHVNRRVQSMNRSIEALHVHYTERNDAEGRAALEDVRNELNIVARGVAIFKMAGTVEVAEAALAGVIWPFNRLREALDRLEACCPVDGLAPVGSQAPPAP